MRDRRLTGRDVERETERLHATSRLYANDVVEEWKRSVRAHVSSQKHTRCQPVLQLRVSFGFVLIAALLGTAGGSSGALTSFLVLGSTLFVHELARAVFARSLERSSTICISSAGADTEVSGAPLGGLRSALFTVIGSIANGGIALLVLTILRRGVGADTEPALRLVLVTHAVWAIVHLLPLTPFDMGKLVTRWLSPAGRFTQAVASAVVVSTFVNVSCQVSSCVLMPSATRC